MTHDDHDGRPGALAALERYYDAAPRRAARVEDFGPLTLFVRDGAGPPYYARPTLGAGAPVTAADVARVRERQRALGVPESFEWVARTTPSLRAAAEESGLVVHEHPLMVLPADAPDPVVPDRVDGAVIRVLGPRDPLLASALAVGDLAFDAPGTAVGTAGAAEVDAAVLARAGDGSLDRTAEWIRSGLTAVAAAVENGRAVCSGKHGPVGDVTEVVSLGTVPAARRRGLATAVTAALVAEARSHGVTTVFLSAEDEAVARVYTRVGFRPVGTALIAEPPRS